jgi:stage V sporulation protein AA
MDIYIKLKKKATLSEQQAIYVSDVADIAADENTAKINKIILRKIHDTNKNKINYLISVTDVVKAVKEKFPSSVVHCVGENDTWVQYAKHKSRDNPLLKWAKVAFVVLVLGIGSATAIMAFHTDSDLPRVFSNYFKLFFGEENTRASIITIPYALGLAVGILAFYNHFFGKKITDDPTPIEVEMEQYEKQVTETMVELMSLSEKNEKIGGGK